MLLFQVRLKDPEKVYKEIHGSVLENAMKANKMTVDKTEYKSDPVLMVVAQTTPKGVEINSGKLWLKQYKNSSRLFLKGIIDGMGVQIEENSVKGVFFIGDKADIITKKADKNTGKSSVSGTIMAIGRSWDDGPITVKEGSIEYIVNTHDIVSIDSMKVRGPK